VPELTAGRTGPPHNPGLRKLIEGKRQRHRAEHALPLALKAALRYTESNPVKAALVAELKSWRWGSARWRDEYERLPWLRDEAAA
jgi:hypothetical protein